jgi:hypothetical protein
MLVLCVLTYVETEENAAKLPPPPTGYQALVPRYDLHEAYNTLPTNPSKLEGFDFTPVSVFRLFWSGEMLETITRNTNIYAKLQGAEHTRNGKGQGRSWKELTVDELKIWLGITILMGVTREPSVKDYWRNDDGCNSVHRFTEFMSLCRFEQIKRYIHISLPQEDDGKLTPESENQRPDLWYRKVAWLLDHLEACAYKRALTFVLLCCCRCCRAM